MKTTTCCTKAVKFTIIVGKVTLSVPLGCGRSRPSWLYRSYLVLQGLVALSSTILMLDSCMTNHPYVFAASEKPSVLIATYIVYLSAVLPDLLVRSSTFLLREQISTLNFKVQMMSSSGLTSRNSGLLLCWILLCTCWMILRSYNLTMIAMSFNFSGGFTTTLLPPVEYLIRLAYTTTNGLCALSMFYATLYVVIFGNALVRQLKDYVCIFRSRAELQLRVSSICKCSSSRRGDISQSLLAEFNSLKNSFEQYGTVAGIYFVAIFMHFTMCIIRFISDVKTGSENEGRSPIWLQIIKIQYGGYLLALPFLANFGHWMTKEVAKNKAKIREIDVDSKYNLDDRMSKLSRWIGKWEWKLTAFYLFDVDRTLVPTVSAIILTYFIFLMQIKASERDGSLKA